MRLHHLNLTAFGPFAGAEEVDFDELCDAGLFLLTGPTGAGKTTILDAVCFALYGSVPGVRGVKALKSQHAADDARPEVVLDFSVRDRRFVVRRSPEWARPKRRGEGFTTENARATLVETTSGEDHLLSSRAQEVGHFVGELIGMQATQFVQVAMLPQGDFQKFLRASSQDRHDVLQHLFRTDRYARIEDWVQDHSRALKERSVAGQQSVIRVLDTVADRVGAELPDDLTDDALQAPEAQERSLSWVDSLIATAEVTHTAALDQHTAAAAASTESRARYDEARRLRALHERRDGARLALEELAHEAEEEQHASRLLDADDRASRCLPLLRMLDEAAERRERVAGSWAESAGRLARLDAGDLSLPDPVTTDALAELEQRSRASAARLEALLPRERELQVARHGVTVAETELAALITDRTAASERAEELPAELAEARTRSAALSASGARTEALTLELDQALARLDAAKAAEQCVGSLGVLRDAEREARDRAADARDVVQDLTARRLAGIAAELAGRLVAGEPCQVCGSTDHPEPATPSQGSVTEAEQAEAATAHEAAAAAHAAASGKVLQTAERLEALRVAASRQTPDEAAARVHALSVGLEEARAAKAALDGADALVERLSREQDDLTKRLHDVALRIASLEQTLETYRRTIEVLGAELAAQTDVDVPLGAQVAHLTHLATSYAAAREALGEHDAAVARVTELEEHAEEAAREHGFDDARALRSATLDPSERARLEELLASRRQAHARATAVLEDPEIRALGDQPPADPAVVSAAAVHADEQETLAARSLHQAEESVAALRRQSLRLQEALTSWAPVQEEYLRAESMSKLVRGMGADNQLQMRLSAYVLATRLDQVVAAANERLAHMRDQRYLLQRTGRAARKGAQAGLGLEVVDQWTGDVRDPATLSGGETFVVSLALALGLADVVTQEAGGTEIETLFVDEGFGTLDADTLDDVMDRLDDLRAGGRAVGVVSHVSELRNRIPTQLHVDKRRSGSAVAVRTTVG